MKNKNLNKKLRQEIESLEEIISMLDNPNYKVKNAFIIAKDGFNVKRGVVFVDRNDCYIGTAGLVDYCYWDEVDLFGFINCYVFRESCEIEGEIEEFKFVKFVLNKKEFDNWFYGQVLEDVGFLKFGKYLG